MAVRATGWRPLVFGKRWRDRKIRTDTRHRDADDFAITTRTASASPRQRRCAQRWAGAGLEAIIRMPNGVGKDRRMADASEHPEQYFDKRGTTERYAPSNGSTAKSGDAPKLNALTSPATTPSRSRARWGVRDRFPRRNVALLSGEGAIGKSIVLLQLAVAHVLGRDWLRSMPEQGPVLLVNCEDEGEELVRRLRPILTATMQNSPTSRPICTPSRWPIAIRCWPRPIATAAWSPTPLYAELVEKVRTVQPICTVIDNVADVFGGGEIDRSQVRQFVAMMRQIAIAANGYVIMSSHPSLSGIASKSGLSGSTQWHKSMRARAYMHMLTETGGDNTTGTRVLEFHEKQLQRTVRAGRTAMVERPVSAGAGTSGPEQAANRTPPWMRYSCDCSNDRRPRARTSAPADRQQLRADRVRQNPRSQSRAFRPRPFRRCARPSDRGRNGRCRTVWRAEPRHLPHCERGGFCRPSTSPARPVSSLHK